MSDANAPESRLGYRLFDADNHYYEPRDCFTRFMEPKYRDKAIQVKRVDGKDRVFVGDKPFTFLSEQWLD